MAQPLEGIDTENLTEVYKRLCDLCVAYEMARYGRRPLPFSRQQYYANRQTAEYLCEELDRRYEEELRRNYDHDTNC